MTLQNIKISLRSDSLENWISSNPVLKNGELVMVNDISADLVRFKIGNGVSAFMQLPYVNEKKVITDFAKSKRTESQYFSQGVNNFVSPLGFAAGNYITADSSFAQVLGINACAPEGHDYSFVWNGDGSGTIGVQSYRSHGEGTFNVNPVGGVDGFYVGNQTLSGILSSTCQPKGNYLSSSALDGYRTYDNTVTSLTTQSGFKTYADTKSSLSSDGYSTQAQLDTKSSVSVDNQRADVNILHISQEEYNQLVVRNEVLSNFIYVVSDDCVNAYGEQIKNLAPGTDLSDAVNLQQLQAAVESVPLSDYYTKTAIDSKLTDKADAETVYTKAETDNAISGALSAKEDAKYIESEDGAQRIYGNGDVSVLSSAPGTYGPWTDEESNVDDTWQVTEISSGVFGYMHGDNTSQRSVESWISREEAENAKTFSTNDGNVWTKPYIPGPENWVKEGELALKSDVSVVTENIRYKLITKTLQEGTYNDQSVLTCQIDDRAITTIEVSSSEKDVVLYLPPKPADGGARDFIIRVEVTASTVPGFYFIGASETINYDSGDEDWNILEPGLNLISFTETK